MLLSVILEQMQNQAAVRQDSSSPSKKPLNLAIVCVVMVLQVTARLELFELGQQQSIALEFSRFCVKSKFLSEEASHGLISLLLFCKIKTVSKRN